MLPLHQCKLEFFTAVLESGPLTLPMHKVFLQLLFGGPLDCCDSVGPLLLLLLLRLLEYFDSVLESGPLALQLCPMALQLLLNQLRDVSVIGLLEVDKSLYEACQ